MVLGGYSCKSHGRRAQMLGVRFGAVCTIVLGGMLVASAAHAAQVCDQRSSRTCKSAAAQSNRESPKTTNAPRAATATRSRRVARHRHGVKHAQSAKPAAEAAGRPAIASPAPSPAQEVSRAARRFSEFVSPRLLAANPVEELHKPRMNLSQFSSQTAYPLLDAVAVDREPSGAAVIATPTASRNAPEGVAPGEPPRAANEQTPAVAQAEGNVQFSANLVSRSSERDSSDGSTSWVQIVFLTWGGLLTLGSALRLLIG
jgi:hypothetical protein